MICSTMLYVKWYTKDCMIIESSWICILVYVCSVSRTRGAVKIFRRRNGLPVIAEWNVLCVGLRESNHVDGMDELHWTYIEVHLVFFENTLGAPALKREFPCVSLCVLSDLAAIRP